MRVTKVSVLRSVEPICLPQPWRPAWTEPSGPLVTEFRFSVYKVGTDAGLTGYGPFTGCANPGAILGTDPTHVGAFWQTQMSGRRSLNSGRGAAGLEVALWDIVGKAAGMPIHRLFGACRDRMPVYAATSRLLSAEEHVQQVRELVEQGFRAVKLRLHRSDPRADLAVVESVRAAVGDRVTLLVDANQNNYSDGYPWWSRRTALQMARALDDLQVYFLEEPLPRGDVEGLADIADAVDMFIAGGEHTPTAYDWREHIVRGAYDILQPDVILGGNHGIIGLRQVTAFADLHGRLVVPHVCGAGLFPLALPATLHAMATVENCPLVEYPFDPPILTPATQQAILREPLVVGSDGCVALPDTPGLGVELCEDLLSEDVLASLGR